MTAKTVKIFDASVQKDVDHTLDIDGNGEVVLTSVETGHFIKLPATTTKESLKTYIAAHRAANLGQITKASIDTKKQELIDSLLG